MDISVLGPLEVRIDGESKNLGGKKQRSLFALLAVSVPDLVPTDQLLQGIWGADVAPNTKGVLQTYVYNLRAVLNGGVVYDRGGYRLDVDPESVDAVRFEDAIERARSKLATQPEAAASELRAALAMWRGRPLGDLLDVPGLEPAIRRYEQRRLDAVEARFDAELAAGNHEAVVIEVTALAEEHPTRERFRAQHMLALFRAGRQAEALAAYRRTETFLTEELGLEPSAELRELELAILQQDDAVLAGPGRAMTQRLAFLVTDIEGSTRLWDRDRQRMAEALSIHDRLLREAVENSGGRVFKHTGDGVLAVFSEVASAVEAAEAAQRGLNSQDWGTMGEIRVRMGVDVGDAETRGNDFFGPPLNRASRICAAAHGGQVLVSSGVQQEIGAASPAGVQVRHLGAHRLRGLASPERLAQLVFVGLPADFPDLHPEQSATLNDRLALPAVPGYETRDRIGEGAFGVVYRAYQPSVGREVAIKVIRPDLADRPSFVRRFEAEARTIARLAHPHIVPLIDFWRDAQGAYLVLQLIAGGSLRELLGRTTVDRATARRILGQLAAALDHAHSRAVFHGDVKPANVLIDEDRNAYLSDFGIAARLLDPDLVASVSSAPLFRAPEETSTGPTAASDLYALGRLARELIVDASDLEPVLARATAINPSDRYPTADAFIRSLDDLLGEVPEPVDLPAISRNPYKGLRAFDEGDAADFHGRDDLIAALVAAVRQHRLVMVVGPSGSGKSSAVRAGLVPSLVTGRIPESEHWYNVTFSPRTQPFESMAEALTPVMADRSPDATSLRTPGTLVEAAGDFLEPGASELLMVIDQFEELWTLDSDAETRTAFLEMLVRSVTEAASRIRVVATLRADFYDRPLEHDLLGRLVSDGLVTVLRPTRDEVVDMITAPGEAVGLRWEPGLPHRIALDVADQPGGLPLLQYALTEMVERRGGDLVTSADYERIGGVSGALAMRAESVYRDLTPSQQEAARQVLLRLVTVDEDSDDTRRLVRRSELESLDLERADLERVLEAFTSGRLLLADRDPVTRGPTVEVAHEALLREWPRLRGWIEDQREALILGRRFRTAILDWETNERHEDHLLSGHRLAPFVVWAESSSLTPEERSFYGASAAKDETERRGRRRRRRALTGILAGAAVLGISLGSLAALQASRATDEAEAARQAEGRAESEAERANDSARLARSRELVAAAEAALDTDPELAKLLAVSSTQFAEPTVDTMSILHRVFASDRIIARYSWPGTELHGADLHPRGSLMVATGIDPARLEVYDMVADRPAWSWESEGGTVIENAHFTVDGERVIAGILPTQEEEVVGATGVHVWDSATGELVRVHDFGECAHDVFAVSENRALTGFPGDDCLADAATLGVLDLQTGEWTQVATEAHVGAMSGDGRFVAYTDAEFSRVVEVSTGEIVLEYPRGQHPGLVPDGFVQSLNHDGSLLVAGERPMAVWDVAAGEIVEQFHGHAGESRAWEFSEENVVVSAGREDTVHIWSADGGAEIASFPAAASGRLAVAGTRILASDWATDQIVLLETAPRGEVWSLPTCGGFALGGGFSADGGYAALAEICGNGDGFTFVVDVESRSIAASLPGFAVQHQALSPDGTRLVRQEETGPPVDRDGALTRSVGPPIVRNVATGEVLVELEGICAFEYSSHFPLNPEGCNPYPETPFAMASWQIVWSPDSALIAIVRPGVTVWDSTSGDLVWSLDAETNDGCGPDSVIFVDESMLLNCASDGSLLSVSTTTWEHSQIPMAGPGGSLAGITPDDRFMLRILNASSFGAGSLEWIDLETFEVVASIEQIHDGAPKSHAMSPDRRLLATGSSDGFVKVWDLVDRRLVQEIFVAPTQIQGLGFVDDRHLGVAPQSGSLLVYALDAEELVDIVGSSLLRGFTSAECARFDFGADCPTLEELKAG